MISGLKSQSFEGKLDLEGFLDWMLTVERVF